MKNAVIRADAAILKILTTIVQRYVARYDFKQHKIDLLIRIEWIMLGAAVLWATIIPALLYAVAGDPIQGGIHLFLWGLMCGLDFFSVQTTIHRIKPYHDLLFSMREEPEVHARVKEMLERGFIESRRARVNQIAIMFAVLVACVGFLMLLGFDAPMFFVVQYLVLSTVIGFVKRYFLYVFDFDEPKKKKKASEWISDLVKRLWSETVGGFSPMPMPA